MRYYPVFLDLEAKTVVIVGGGAEAAQKLRLMAKTPARIVVVTPFAERELSTEIDAAGACLISREFDADDRLTNERYRASLEALIEKLAKAV